MYTGITTMKMRTKMGDGNDDDCTVFVYMVGYRGANRITPLLRGIRRSLILFVAPNNPPSGHVCIREIATCETSLFPTRLFFGEPKQRSGGMVNSIVYQAHAAIVPAPVFFRCRHAPSTLHREWVLLMQSSLQSNAANGRISLQ